MSGSNVAAKAKPNFFQQYTSDLSGILQIQREYYHKLHLGLIEVQVRCQVKITI